MKSNNKYLQLGGALTLGALTFYHYSKHKEQLIQQQLLCSEVINLHQFKPSFIDSSEYNERQQSLSDINYVIHINIQDHSYCGQVSITFNYIHQMNQLFVDWNGKAVSSLIVNGNQSPIKLDSNKIFIPMVYLKLKSQNKIIINFQNNYSRMMIGCHQILNYYGFFIYTQAECLNTQSIFPCFDQIEFKSNFTLTLSHHEKFQVFSNMPIQKTLQDNLTIQTQFQTTQQRISTYQFAFAVGQYRKFKPESEYLINKRVQIIVRYNVINEIADEEIKEVFKLIELILVELENISQIPIPYEKLDFLFVPQFLQEAMENPGLFIFDEDKYLFKQKRKRTIKKLIRRAYILAHEMSHTYFGNYVIPLHQNDLWLKEGFATHFGYKIISKITPKLYNVYGETVNQYYKVKLNGILGQLNQAAIKHELGHPAMYHLLEYHNEINYAKASMFIYTLERIIGCDNFRNVIKEYLNTAKNQISTDQFVDMINKIQVEQERLFQLVHQVLFTQDTQIYELLCDHQHDLLKLQLNIHSYPDKKENELQQFYPIKVLLLVHNQNGYAWKESEIFKEKIDLDIKDQEPLLVLISLDSYGFSLFPKFNSEQIKKHHLRICSQMNEYYFSLLHQSLMTTILINDSDFYVNDVWMLIEFLYFGIPIQLFQQQDQYDLNSSELMFEVCFENLLKCLSNTSIKQVSLQQQNGNVKQEIQIRLAEHTIITCYEDHQNVRFIAILRKFLKWMKFNEELKVKIQNLMEYFNKEYQGIQQKEIVEIDALNLFSNLRQDREFLRDVLSEVELAVQSMNDMIGLSLAVINLFKNNSLFFSTKIFQAILKGLDSGKQNELKQKLKNHLLNKDLELNEKILMKQLNK